MKKKFVVTMAVLMLCSCGKYGDEENMAERYLNESMGLEGEITNTEFYHYDEGITGGLYMYEFKFRENNGNILDVKYSSYEDICEENLHMLVISQEGE